jgi:hypothetical protein
MNLSRYNRAIWKYSDTTPPEKLHRHHRVFRRIAFAGMWAFVTAISSLPFFLLKQNPSTSETITLGALALISFALCVPSIFAYICLSEIEKAMQGRKLPLPLRHPIDYYADRCFRRILLWAAAVILLPAAVRYLLSLFA